MLCGCSIIREGNWGFFPPFVTASTSAGHVTNHMAQCIADERLRMMPGVAAAAALIRGEPTTFAPYQVIRGWTEAMQLMVEGDHWQLFIPPELAYGAGGIPGVIPGGSTLLFELEMIEIKGEKVPA